MCATPYQTTNHRLILEAKRYELERRLRQRDPIEVVRESDAMDAALTLAAREREAGAIDADTQLLRQVWAAIERLAAGEWGWCSECGEKIGEKRLAAVPWSRFCLKCAERVDAEERTA